MMNRLLLGALMAERTAPTEAKVWRDSDALRLYCMNFPLQAIRVHVHVRTVQCSNRGAAQELQGSFHLRAQHVDGSSDASGTTRGQPVGVRASDQNGARSQANGFYDIASAAHPAIHEHFDLAVHGGHDFGQDL